MTTKHTPGPWELQVGEDACFHKGNRFAITKSGEDDGEPWNVTIAEVWPSDNGADHADARLIAAAPELLAALQEIIPAYLGALAEASRTDSEPYEESPAGLMLSLARAAIAKATGDA